jgi:cell division protein FtsW
VSAPATATRRNPPRPAAPCQDARRRGADPGAPGWLDRPLASYYLLLGSAGLLLLLGLVMVLSASSVKSYVATGTPYDIFRRQVVWVALGLPALWLGLRLRLRTYRMLAYPTLLVSVGLMVLVLVPGVGSTVRGSSRWLDLGPLWLQPSELAKLGLALWGADLLVRKRPLLTRWKHLLVPLLPVATLDFVLVMLEPDLGTTLCLIVIVLSLLFFLGAPVRMFGLLCATMGGLVAVVIAVEPYRMARVTSFLHPFDDAQRTGFQAVQGIYSLSSGGWWGVGLGGSSGKWNVPNAYTDYIFAIIGEELGLMGALLVLALFAVFAYAGLRIARRSTDPFARLVAGSVMAWLIGQAIINIGYVVGLLPVTGIPLPLISFGGTSLVLTMFVVGMLASFARAEPRAAAAILARGPTRWSRLLLLPTPVSTPVSVPPRPARSAAARPRTAAARPRTAAARPGAGTARHPREGRR